MTKRYEYLTFLFEYLFFGNFNDIDPHGYTEFDEDILAYLPIDKEIEKVMQHYMMRDISGILIYGGPKTKKNWWYTYFDTDDISQVFNFGNFNFEMSITAEHEDAGEDSFRTQVEFIDFKLDGMYIDMESEDIWLVKDGEYTE